MTEVTFEPVNWQPQVEVTFTRDVHGYHSHEEQVMWSFKAGSTHMIDEQTATEFIVKGYATGELPRHVSDDEATEIRSVMSHVGMG